MAPPSCPLCCGLDNRQLRRLIQKTYSPGQDPRRWMPADEIRASARGIGSTTHSGAEHPFVWPCETCSLLQDAAETFLRESGLAVSDPATMDYLLAVQDNLESADVEEEEGEDSGSETATESSWQDVDEHSDNGAANDGGQHLPPRAHVKKAGAITPAKIQVVLRCSFNPPKAKAQSEPAEEFELEIFTTAGETSPKLDMVGRAEEVLTTPDPDGYAAKINAWLQDCHDNHATCQQFASISIPKPLPKRVLDLSNDKIVLIATGHRKGAYVALSHAWGNDEVLTTSKETIQDRMKDIAYETLPQAFRDAVLVTRALGLKYLWIDSLCIIQGDAKDWQDQSGKMADIYGGCYLNIAATRCSSSREGFLGPRWTARNTWDWVRHYSAAAPTNQAPPESRVRRCEVKSYPISNHDTPARYPEGLMVRLKLNASHDSMQTFRWMYMHKTEAPLIQRAWVYQETNLSPRTVHFHANEMVWDCPERQHCECCILDGMEFGVDVWSASKHQMAGLRFLDQAQLHGLWRTIVEDYCLLNLTYESDRLPALSGLASRFSEFMPNDTYLAGLWRSTLGRDLLWKIQPESTAKVSRRWQLGDKSPPSWSWASLVYGHGKHGMRWEFETKPRLTKWSELFTYKQDRRFSVLKASCSVLDPSPFGHASGGSITVTGAMCAIAIVDDTAPIPRGWADQIPIKSKDLFNSLHFDYDDAKDEEEITSPGNPVRGLIFCLFIGTFFSHFELDKKNNHPHLQGLMLKPSTRVPGTAERIGSWGQYIEHWTVGREVFAQEAATVTVTIV